jgi:hypothetical protein
MPNTTMIHETASPQVTQICGNTGDIPVHNHHLAAPLARIFKHRNTRNTNFLVKSSKIQVNEIIKIDEL